MRVREIALDRDDEDIPASVMVTMSHDEALFIAKHLGGMNGYQQDAVIANGSTVGSGIYDCLSGFFNRFYDEGVDGAWRTRRPIPAKSSDDSEVGGVS